MDVLGKRVRLAIICADQPQCCDCRLKGGNCPACGKEVGFLEIREGTYLIPDEIIEKEYEKAFSEEKEMRLEALQEPPAMNFIGCTVMIYMYGGGSDGIRQV